MLINESSARRFLTKMMPELINDEVFTLMLASRKKYNKTIRTSSEMLDFGIIKDNDIEHCIRKIERMISKIPYYIDFKTNEPIPESSLVLYIDLYPKSIIKALQQFNIDVNKWMYDAIVNPEFNKRIFTKIERVLFSSVAKSPSRKPLRMLDLDSTDEKLLKEILHELPESDWITRTRGGFHIMFKAETKEKTRKIGECCYRISQKYDEIEFQSHQALTPIVGTLQGGVEVTKYYCEMID